MIEGESGILACSAPWERPEITENMLVWKNGARAAIFSPESPGAIFGPQHDLVWMSEIHAWPHQTAEVTYKNIQHGLRLRDAQLLWDSNPAANNPVLELLLGKHRRDPVNHVLVTGSTRDNIANLNERAVAEWYEDDGGTPLGRMMLDGLMPPGTDGALWRGEDIQVAQEVPSITRVSIGADPATTSNARSDETGLIVSGLGVDGVAYVLEDLSGKHVWEVWGELAVDAYIRHKASVVVVERNAGGDACASNIRLAARAKGLTVVELGPEDRAPAPRQGVLWLRQTTSLDDKTSRARPIAAAYRMGKVRHVPGLGSLVREMCKWNGYGRSPNRIDALVFAVAELLSLGVDLPSVATAGDLTAAARAIGVASAGVGGKPLLGVQQLAALTARLGGVGAGRI
jgi:phage terminase large subunit-like protein